MESWGGGRELEKTSREDRGGDTEERAFQALSGGILCDPPNGDNCPLLFFVFVLVLFGLFSREIFDVNNLNCAN